MTEHLFVIVLLEKKKKHDKWIPLSTLMIVHDWYHLARLLLYCTSNTYTRILTHTHKRKSSTFSSYVARHKKGNLNFHLSMYTFSGFVFLNFVSINQRMKKLLSVCWLWEIRMSKFWWLASFAIDELFDIGIQRISICAREELHLISSLDRQCCHLVICLTDSLFVSLFFSSSSSSSSSSSFLLPVVIRKTGLRISNDFHLVLLSRTACCFPQ